MQMRFKGQGEFERLYPKTLSGNVTFNNGVNLEEYKKEVDDYINKTEDKFEELWNGRDVLGTDSIITPSKKLSDCVNGWLLVFKNSVNTNNWNYYHIPKIHLKISTNQTVEGVKIITGSPGGLINHKYVFVTDTEIKGYSSNAEGDNAKSELFRVYEY